MNLEEPAKVDEKVKAQFNAIQKRAEEHRSM